MIIHTLVSVDAIATGERSIEPGIYCNTPWGPSQGFELACPGILWVVTASHGGIYCSPAVNDAIPDYMRRGACWYEEDCDWAIVACAHPSAFSPDDVSAARTTLRNWYPDEYERFYDVQLEPGESYIRDRDIFYRTYANHWVAYSCQQHSSGRLLCHAALGLGVAACFQGKSSGPVRSYLVSPEHYYAEKSPYGYVIDPNVDVRYQEAA